MPFAFDTDPACCAAALARLAAIGFAEQTVRDRLGLEDINDLQAKALPIYRQEQIQERDLLASAIDLFLLQGQIPFSELDRLFGPPEQEALFNAGILARDGARVHAEATLYPVGQNLIFSDYAWPQLLKAGYSTVASDQVMYVGTDSRWLARATVRKPVGSALDLCCGSGVQALLAASHAEHVTAVDVNPRAVRCTAFNARAWRLSNLEAVQGDLYQAVRDRRFDLITANPPFVPAPAQEVGFRDGGPSGEEIQRRIVEGLPRHLAQGGIAQIVTELGERDEEPLERRLREWLDGAPMDIHILRLRLHSAKVYAIGHADGDDHTAILNSVGRWAANLEVQRYRSVRSVLLAFQWSKTPWCRVDDALPPQRDAGAEVEEVWLAERLSRSSELRTGLRTGRVERTGPIALLEARALGVQTPPTVQARLAGQAMPVEHALDLVERDLLTCLDQPVATADLVAAADRAALSEATVLDALVSLVRKGLIRLSSSA
ncbi:MAG TPA: methyltransferase [Vicinamibacterales bacterium]|jgi:methylase of polypeptide subunit release factors